MPSQPQRTTSSRTKRQRRGTNKSQLQAAAVRAAQTHEDVFATAKPLYGNEKTESQAEVGLIEPRRRSGVRTPVGRGRANTARPVVNVRKLTREQEFTFIKADMRRLLVTAGSLAVIMIALLFIIDR